VDNPNSSGLSLCIAGWWPEQDSVNGIFIREHVLAIARLRPVEVITMSVVKAAGWPRIQVSTTTDEGVNVHRVALRTPLRRLNVPNLMARLALRRLIRMISRERKVGIVHIHVRTDLTEQTLHAVRPLKVPVVLTEHNSFYHLGIHQLPEPERMRTIAAIRSWLSDPDLLHIMPVSNDLAGTLERVYGVEPHRTTVVTNVAASVFKPGHRPSAPPFIILLAAVWRPPKDYDVFIKAMAQLPLEVKRKCKVVWAGYGPDMVSIQQRCAHELEDVEVSFPGKLERNELAKAMQTAHLFVLPTRSDNQPCVVLESLSCGTPVISMAVNGVPEMIDGSNGVLVPPNDPAALSQALAAYISGEHVPDHDSIASNADAKYSPAVISEAIDKVYQHAMRQFR